jgi:asparagine synthase (glutamine-hydrolysing)
MADHWPEGFRGRDRLKLLSKSGMAAYFPHMMLFAPEIRARLYHPDLARQMRTLEDGDYLRHCFELIAGKDRKTLDFISGCQAIDTLSYLPEDILVKVDRASMFCSLEVRAPLLDFRIVDFMATLPIDFKLRQGTSKYLLKQVIKDLLPASILNRKKHGFGMPLERWFRQNLRDVFADILADPQSQLTKYFQIETLKGVLDRQIYGHGGHGRQLWALLWLELWFRENLDG